MSTLLIVAIIIIITNSKPIKIPLSEHSVTDIFEYYDYKFSYGWPSIYLLNEQEASRDPLYNSSNAGPAYFAWNPQNDNAWYPITYPQFVGPEAVINLNASYQITNICIYWGTIQFSIIWKFMKTNPFEESVVEPIKTTISTDNGYKQNSWNCYISFTQSIIAQFIRLELYNSPQTSLLELVRNT